MDDLGAIPYIPFKSNTLSKPRGNNHIWCRMFNYFEYNKDEFLEYYHKSSNVESVFSSVKKKFGETPKSKNRTAQVNEPLCKFIAYNIMVFVDESHGLWIISNFTNE